MTRDVSQLLFPKLKMAAFHQRTFGQPSQDTLFMRGFHIRQDVDDIRYYFINVIN